MGRAPCCDKAKVKKGPWSPEEDAKLKDFIEKNGTGGNWIALPQKAGLKRCGKSCRLRWLNYLRPNIKHGEFTDEEDRIICSLYAAIGSRWSIIAGQLPGRTDNDIKNYWNTKLKKKLMSMMLLPSSSSPSKQRSSPPHGLLPTLPHQQPFPYSGLESLSLHHYPVDLMYDNNSNSSPYSYNTRFQDHQPGLLNPILMQYHHQVFGGSEQVSGSSSDGSCSQISYDISKVDHLKQQQQQPPPDHHHNKVMMLGGKYYSFQGDDDGPHHQIMPSSPAQGHNFFLDFGNTAAVNAHETHNDHLVMNNGQFGNNNTDPTSATTMATTQQLQYDLDVVRDLVSSSNGQDSNTINNNFLLFDNYENKTEEGQKGTMYFY